MGVKEAKATPASDEIQQRAGKCHLINPHRHFPSLRVRVVLGIRVIPVTLARLAGRYDDVAT